MIPKIALFGMAIDAVRMDQAVACLQQWIAQPRRHCRYVVTPNVDHVVMFHERADVRAAYDEASLVLADGWPVVLASRLLGKPLPERVAGSDLAPALFASIKPEKPLRVFLLGAAPKVGEIAAQAITAKWPDVHVVGVYSPPLGFERDNTENEKIIKLVSDANPDVLVLGLGAPKQELWIHRFHERLPACIALCVGATIDFLAGHKSRAPKWMRKCGLEWLHRLASEPKRLFRRYWHDAQVFPGLVWREWRANAANRSGSKSPAKQGSA